MPHDGEILELVVRKYRPNITALAVDMEYDRATIYRHFGLEEIEEGILLKYAKALKYDFKDEFPRLQKLLMVNEPAQRYGNLPESLEAQVSLFKELYYEQVAENNRLLKELMAERAKKK